MDGLELHVRYWGEPKSTKCIPERDENCPVLPFAIKMGVTWNMICPNIYGHIWFYLPVPNCSAKLSAGGCTPWTFLTAQIALQTLGFGLISFIRLLNCLWTEIAHLYILKQKWEVENLKRRSVFRFLLQLGFSRGRKTAGIAFLLERDPNL